jgi:hypothetical protein
VAAVRVSQAVQQKVLQVLVTMAARANQAVQQVQVMQGEVTMSVRRQRERGIERALAVKQQIQEILQARKVCQVVVTARAHQEVASTEVVTMQEHREAEGLALVLALVMVMTLQEQQELGVMVKVQALAMTMVAT